MCGVTVLVVSVNLSVSQCVSYRTMAALNGHNSSSIAKKMRQGDAFSDVILLKS